MSILYVSVYAKVSTFFTFYDTLCRSAYESSWDHIVIDHLMLIYGAFCHVIVVIVL